MIGLLLLIPSVQQGTHSSAEKGGI
jgi:hypothetical protein